MSDQNQNRSQPAKRALVLGVGIAIVLGALLFFRSRGADVGNRPHRSLTSRTHQDTELRRVAGPKQPFTKQQDRKAAFRTDNRENLVDRWQQIDDPSQDGWETEAFSEAATKQLKRIGTFLQQPHELASADIADITTSDFHSSLLRPADLELVFRDDIFQVQRARLIKGDSKSNHHFRGPEGFHQALLQLIEPFADANNIRTKFKIFRVHADKNANTTRQYVQITGQVNGGVIEQHATWEADWINRPAAAPLLVSLDVLDFEQVRAQTSEGTLFTDCTESLLGSNACYAEQFLRGYNYWMLQKPYNRYQITEMMGHPGLAIGDVNGDGLDDLYVCQEQGLPNRLFLQQKDGTADEVSAAWGADWLQACRSALLVDLDNDGDQDLVVSFLGGLAIASNEDRAGFRVRSVLPTGDDMISLAAADVDHDGDVDIYTTAYYADKQLSERQLAGLPAAGDAFVYHDANVGGYNRLLRNDINQDSWSFADVTEESGLGVNNTRYSFAAAWEDYDNDGDQDLYVANDYGRDNLYRNDDGRFADVSDHVGAEDAASGMSVTWSDFDRDGWADVYVSNMWSAAGNRIAFQPHFKKDADPEVKQRLQRFARGNTLLHNNGQTQFVDVSAKSGVEMGRWAWGSLFADVNNDGWDDLLIANGFITKDENSGDL